jgi:hypothetical protein
MSNKETVGSRIPKDVYEQFESYREEHDLNKSTAGARLIERGLDWETGEVEAETETGPALSEQLQNAGLALLGLTFAAAWVSPDWVTSVVGFLAAVVFASAAAVQWRAGQ